MQKRKENKRKEKGDYDIKNIINYYLNKKKIILVVTLSPKIHRVGFDSRSASIKSINVVDIKTNEDLVYKYLFYTARLSILVLNLVLNNQPPI